MRHRWFSVEEDVRLDITHPRPILDRCRVCGTYRWRFPQADYWVTYYGEPYKWHVTRAPECVPVKGAHQWLEDVG